MTERAALVLAVDPGLGGAVAWYHPSHPHLIRVDDMPVVDREVDADTFQAWVWQMTPDFAVVERVGSRPGEGHTASFKFGTGWGMIRGVLAACHVPLYLVTPQAWKKHHHLIGKDKEASRALAMRLWPGVERFARKKDDGRAEAALMARWGAETVLVDRAVAQIRREVAA